MNVAIIQARMGSSRLPGKVLKTLGARSVLEHVIARARRIDGIDAVCCAIPESDSNDALAAEAARCGAGVFRGDESDVLGRYHGAAAAIGATVVMRITSDCPLLDWRVSSGVLAKFHKERLDYCSNLTPRSWPKGLDTEVFSIAVLNEMAAEATEAADREHVTPYARRRPGYRRGGTVCVEGDFSRWRWTLDYPEDLEFFRAVLERAASDFPTFEDVRGIVERAPEIARINAHLT
jgi:spore coat polysaccharide biosynthesis protein SpsF (cytidylyltransferase family)